MPYTKGVIYSYKENLHVLHAIIEFKLIDM